VNVKASHKLNKAPLTTTTSNKTFQAISAIVAILRISGLTLILLTWRIWWALNNASRWQMGFNPAFKGL